MELVEEQTHAHTTENQDTAQASSHNTEAVGYDPLVTPDYVMGDEEAACRSRTEDHRRLNRRHKPPITTARLEELRLRTKEQEELQERRASVRASLVAAQEAKDSSKEHQFQAELSDIDQLITRRGMHAFHEAQFRLANRFGLLEESDLEHLRAADIRRIKKAEKAKLQARRQALGRSPQV